MDDRGERPPRFSIVFVSDDDLYDSETLNELKVIKQLCFYLTYIWNIL